MKFLINEWDNDYRAWIDSEEHEFDSREEAEAWCKSQSWTGISYSIDESGTEALQNPPPLEPYDGYW